MGGDDGRHAAKVVLIGNRTEDAVRHQCLMWQCLWYAPGPVGQRAPQDSQFFVKSHYRYITYRIESKILVFWPFNIAATRTMAQNANKIALKNMFRRYGHGSSPPPPLSLC